jgi:hypothetical protein
LDHCAFRKISEDRELAAGFHGALAKCNGTLAISWLNIEEFSQVSDPRQRMMAEQFIDKALPRVFFQSLDFPQVAQHERMRAVGAPIKGSPDMDISLFERITPGAARAL